MNQQMNKCPFQSNCLSYQVEVLCPLQPKIGGFGLVQNKLVGGVAAQWVEHWTCNQKVVSSNLLRAKAA